MEYETDISLPALRFLTLDSEHICRLCFASIQNEGVSLEDNVSLQKPYIDETVTYADMFHDLGVPSESSLPLLLCVNCAAMTTNSYLFKRLCLYSNEKWNSSLHKLTISLDQTKTIAPNIQTIYLMINNDDNIMITSRTRHVYKSKKNVIAKIKTTVKEKQPRKKIKRLKSNVICEECGERFTSNCFLIKHMRTHSNTRYPCPQCPKVFSTQIQVEEHSERVHYPKKLPCPKCSRLFSTERMLKYHDKLHHVAAICKLCFVQFPSKKILRAHLDKHDLNKCPQCYKSFVNKYTYKFHLKICGNMDEKRHNFFCDICGKGYVRKNGLRTHMKIDHGFGSVLNCVWCGKKFDAISRLNNHLVKHTKEKNFHCEHCGGKFVTQAALVYHTRLHTGERPFPCDLCNESFLSASRRMEHKRRKHFEPTKECHVCHVKFVTSHQLKKHVERHYNPHSKLFVAEANCNPYTTYEDLSIANSNLKEQQCPSTANLLNSNTEIL